LRIFTYIAIDSEGRGVSGSRRASGREAVEGYLMGQGLTNAEIFASGTVGNRRVSLKELAVFCRMMSVVFISHISITEGLKLIAEQTDNKDLRTALNEINQFMDTGYTFSQSIGMYPHIFGSYPLNLIAVGEISGTLEDVLSRLSTHFDKEDSIKRKLKSAISYPAVLAILMAAIIVLLIVKILPMFESTLESMGGEMALSASVIFRAAAFISQYSSMILIAVLIIIIIAAAYLRTEKGRARLDRLKISAPVFKYVNTRVLTSRYARGLAILLKSGVQLLSAMRELITLVNNAYLEKRFSDAVEKVKNGGDLDDVLSEMNIFPSLFIRLVTIGYSTGRLDEMMEKSAVIFDEEVDHAIERITLTVEPALIIILSVVVGVILLSVMLPMIGIINAIG
jgi:type IV pilus assembly protein PilC